MGRRDEDIEDDVPRRRRSQDDDFEDRPRRSRGRDREEDDDDRPRRRHRDEDNDYDDRPRRVKKSNKGLIIGLIAGGAGLIVVVLVVILVLVLSGGGLKSEIVGKWRDETGTGTYEFTTDEVFRYSRRGRQLTGRYRVIDSTTVEVPNPTGVGAGRPERVRVEINGDVLTAYSIEHPERRPLRLTRIRE